MKRLNIFMTGASGFIGSKLAQRLLAEGHQLHLLQRNPEDVEALKKAGAQVFKGDLLKPDSILKAMQGCSHIVHLAAYAKAWAKDEQTFYKVNYEGGKHVLNAAVETGAKRVLITSTGGVLGASGDGLANEQSRPNEDSMTHYERSKAMLEAEVPAYLKKGLEVVTVNPARVFGPGPVDDSNGELMVMLKYLKGNFRFLPGDGSATASYCHVDDVVEGMRLALHKGRSGERYILGGENASYRTFFNMVGDLSGRSYKMFGVLLPIIMLFAKLQMIKAGLTGQKPVITPELVRKYGQNWSFDSSKAEKELGYTYRSLEQSIMDTLAWIKKEGIV